MAINNPRTGLAINEPIVFSPRSTQASYPYRSGMGMVPSAEWHVFFDDFDKSVTSNLPLGWTAAIIDTGATTVVDTTATAGATGVMLMSDATASEGAAFYGPKSVQLISGKKFMMECRVKLSDVTDHAFQFGLSDLTAVTNPEDIWTTAAANLVTFGILDGAATTSMLADKSNSGSTAETGTSSLVVDTWHTLAIFYDGGSSLKGYVDGKLSSTWAQTFASTVPLATALAPFVGTLNGNGAGANTCQVDFVRIVQER